MPVRDDSGQIVRWFGTCTDIDEQKRIEGALRESQERVNVLMNSGIIGTFVTEEDQVVEANETYLVNSANVRRFFGVMRTFGRDRLLLLSEPVRGQD